MPVDIIITLYLDFRSWTQPTEQYFINVNVCNYYLVNKQFVVAI
jgi:hypothetical protein